MKAADSIHATRCLPIAPAPISQPRRYEADSPRTKELFIAAKTAPPSNQTAAKMQPQEGRRIMNLLSPPRRAFLVRPPDCRGSRWVADYCEARLEGSRWGVDTLPLLGPDEEGRLCGLEVVRGRGSGYLAWRGLACPQRGRDSKL